MKNLYRILNIGQNATEEAIKSQYRIMSKKYHPDLHKDDPNAEARFRELGEAYKTLTDRAARDEYDMMLRLEQAEKTRAKYGKPAPQLVATDPLMAKRLEQILLIGFNDGYEAGYEAATGDAVVAAGGDENEVYNLRREVASLTQNFNNARVKLQAAEKRINDEMGRNTELTAKLDWVRATVRADIGVRNDSLADMATGIATDIECIINDMMGSGVSINGSPSISVAQQERRKTIRETLLATERQVLRLKSELAEIKAIEDQHLEFANVDSYFKSMEEHADKWAKKMRADKNLAKPTLYGALDILIWATEKEIDEAFERIQDAYLNDRSEKSAAKYRAAKQAYNTLASPAARAKYDLKIGYTPEMVAAERKLIAENERIQEEYYSKLQQQTLWTKFENLYDRALYGEADAQNAIGEMYFYGDVIKQDYSHAAYWFQEAFEQAHPAGIYNLGVCYLDGYGVRKNESIAQALFRQANNLGYVPKKHKKKNKQQ